MSCTHAYLKTWEFGPVIYNKEEHSYYWWFYKRCSKCGVIETFPSWQLNPRPRKEPEEIRDLYMIRQQVNNNIYKES